MAKMSAQLYKMLKEFSYTELGSDLTRGMSYAMFYNNIDEKAMRMYVPLEKEAKEYITEGEIFKVHSFINGKVCDIDVRAAEKILVDLIKNIKALNEGADDKSKIPESAYDISLYSVKGYREKAMNNFAKLCKRQFDKGTPKFEVCLYASTEDIETRVFGTTKEGKQLWMVFPAFKMAHTDVETVNKKILIPADIRVSRLTAGEILPNKYGVRFSIEVEAV